jgi:hypothetical protein
MEDLRLSIRLCLASVVPYPLAEACLGYRPDPIANLGQGRAQV